MMRPPDIPARINIASWFIDEPARTFPDQTAVLSDSTKVTYGELRELMNRAGAAFVGMGCKPRDRVLLSVPDSVEFVTAFFGAAKVGALPVPVNPLAKAQEFSHYLQDVEPSVVVVHISSASEVLPVVEKHPAKILVVGEGPCIGNVSRWNEALNESTPLTEAFPTTADDSAFLLYTSGSTEQQRAVVHQHKNMVAASRNVGQGVLGIEPTDRTFSISKLFFAYGLCSGMYFPLSVGASTVLDSEPLKLDRVAQLIKQLKPTILFALPRVFSAMLQAADSWLELDLSTIRLAVCGGEPLPTTLFENFRKRFGLELLDGIGSTEMLTQFMSNMPGHVRTGTCGMPVPNCEAKLIGPDGAEVPVGAIGTLWVKGNTCFAEYWKKPELTARTKRGDWTVTGDTFYRDVDGFYHHCGRNDDKVKISGMWVSLRQVESALLSHPSVEGAVVVAEQDRSGMNRLIAYLAPRMGCEVSTAELWKYLGRTLAPHMLPAAFISLPTLPLTLNGKLDRRSLPRPSWAQECETDPTGHS